MVVAGLSLTSAVTATVVITCVFVAGNVGNVLFCFVFKRSWKLHTWENAFHVNITVANVMAINVTGVTFLLLLWYTDTTSYVYVTACQMYVWSFSALISILASHAAIAVLRCVKVCRPDVIVRKIYVILGLVFCWMLGFILLIHMSLTNTGILFDQQCGFQLFRASPARFTAIIIIMTCLMTLVTSYVITFRKLKIINKVEPSTQGEAKSENQPVFCSKTSVTSVSELFKGVHELDLPPVKVEAPQQHPHSNQETLRYIVRSNVIQFISFVASGGTAVLVSVLSSYLTESMLSAGVVTFSFIFVAFVLNPLIYCVRNRRFRTIAQTFVCAGNS